MTAAAIIDQQYKKLFLDFNFPAEKSYTFEDFKYSWAASTHVREFSASFGYPTQNFYRWVASERNPHQMNIALQLLHRSPGEVDEQVIRLFFSTSDRDALRWIVRIIADRNLVSCVDLLDALQAHSDDDVRGSAIAAKSLLVGPLPWQVDYEKTKDISSVVRLDAYERLAKNDQGVPVLVWLRAQDDSNIDVRRIAISQLAKHDNATIDSIMLDAIKDKDFVVAKAAREYLKKDPDRFFHYLVDVAQNSRAQTTIFALDVLCRSKSAAVIDVLRDTYRNAKSVEVENKILVEMQKIKSDESTKFFLDNGQLKPIRKRKLYKFIDDLVGLAVNQNLDALDLIVEHGKDKTRKALLDVVNNENCKPSYKYKAARLYLNETAETAPEIVALMRDGIASESDFEFFDCIRMMREYKLNQLAGDVRKYAAECKDDNRLATIRKLFDEIGEDCSDIATVEVSIRQVLEGQNEEAIVSVLKRADLHALAGEERELFMLLFRDSSQIRMLAREILQAMDAPKLKRRMKEQLDRYGPPRQLIAIEHASAIGANEFLLQLHKLAYSDYAELSAAAVLALENSGSTKIDTDRLKRNIGNSILLKSDSSASEKLSDDALFDLVWDEHCPFGEKAAKILLSRNSLLARDVDFAYLLMMAQEYDRLLGCSAEQIHSALQKLIHYPGRREFWRALDCLLRKNFDVQPICRNYLAHGFRYQQEGASYALKNVKDLDYRATIKVAMENLGSLDLTLDAILAHSSLIDAEDLKRIYDVHITQFRLLSDKEDGIYFRRAESGIIKLLAVRQRIGCGSFLKDAIQFCERSMNSHVICSIGNDPSSEAKLYLTSLLRTKAVHTASHALRDRVHDLKDPGNRLVVALFTGQVDLFPGIAAEIDNISRETFDVLQMVTHHHSLNSAFIELVKVVGEKVYVHALRDPSSVHPTISTLLCDCFSQKAYPEAEEFLIFNLHHYGHGSQKKIYCIRGLGKIKCSRAGILIEPSLKSKDAVEQRAAIEALGRIGGAGSIQQLEEIRSGLRKNLVEVCDKAITQISRRLQPSESGDMPKGVN